MSAADGTRWVRAPHVLQRRTLDAFTLLAVTADEPVIVAGTGTDVWTLLTEARTLDDLVGILAEAYAGDPEAIATDVRALLDLFVAGGVALRIPPAADGPVDRRD